MIEFVPKSDSMMQRLLRLREDIIANYGEESFRSIVVAGGRALYWYDRQ